MMRSQTGDQAVDLVGRVWADVLGVDSVPPDVNFFDAGGHSLLLLVLQEQLTDVAGRQVPIEDLFVHTTVRAQAELLSADETE